MNDNRLTVDDPLSPSALQRIDALCERFENAWQAGQRPRLDDYLSEVAESERSHLLRELIALDIDYRRQLGEKPEARDYREYASSLKEGWLERLTGASRYELAGEIGRGGMGTVLQGYDRHLRRDLAVKMLRPEHHDQPYLVRRFLREAWIGARLQHPGIVPVYDLGEFADRQPYFTMKLVRGHTLETLLEERVNSTAELPRLLTIFEQVCQTVAYAHAQGIIHRDLKPANIMVGAFGEVQVMDWGLAKVLDWAWGDGIVAGRDAGMSARTMESTDPGLQTQAGQAMGTYAYMPPEQARGEVDRLDERSDVFGLGAILCEILIGTPPFCGQNAEELFERAKACDHQEAMARLDGCGAEATLLRLTKACLAAEPDDRPSNAGVVAEAVKAYLAGVQEQLRAAEVTAAQAMVRAEEERKTARQERRTRRFAVTLAGTFLLLVAIATSFAVFYFYAAGRMEESANDIRDKAETIVQKKDEVSEALKASRRQNAERRRALYNATIQEVHHAWLDANISRSLLLLKSDACIPHDGEEDLRGWEYGYLRQLCHKDVRTLQLDASAPNALTFSPDGRWLAAGCWDGKAVEVWTADGGRKVFTLEGHSAPVFCLAFRRDGRLLASGGGDGTVRLWDMDSGKTVKILVVPKAPNQKPSDHPTLRSLAFRPDGKQLAVGGWDGFVTLWDAESGTQAHRFHAGVGLVQGLAYHPNGRWLAYSGQSRTARLWDVETRQLIRAFNGHGQQVSSIVFSADGRTTATSSEDETIGIWDTDSGQRLKLLKGHNAWVYRLCFVPRNGLSGALLASCSDDGTVRVWDVSSGTVQRVFRGHTNRYVRGLSAHPDGWRLASAAHDGTIKLWDLAAPSQEYTTLQADLRSILTNFAGPVFVRAVFSPDGRLLACPSRNGTVQVWQVGTQKLHQVFRAHRAEVWGLAFTPDGRTIASGDLAGVLHLWESDTGRIQHTFAGRRAGIRSVAIDRDGRRLASAHNDGTVLLRDLAERALLHTFTAHEGGANDVIFSPDGRLLASSGNDGLIKLWDVEERRLRRTLELQEKRVTSLEKRVTRLAFRRDGRRLASAGYDNIVRLWDPSSGELLQTIHGHAHLICGLAFSPDGRRLASASFDKTIKLWDAENGQEILTLRDDQGSVYDAAFSPDGRWLATTGTAFTLRLWDSSHDFSTATDQAVFAEHVKVLQARVSSQLRQAVRSKQLKQFAAAETAYREASGAAVDLVAADPRDPSFRRQLGTILNEQGLLLLNQDARLAESERLLRQALDIRRDLVNEEPESANGQSDLGGTLNNLAIVRRKSGATAEARGLAEEAILHQQTALKINPHHPTYLRFLGNHYHVLGDALLDAGDHAGAAEAANRLRQTAIPGQMAPHSATCLLARCAGVVEKDDALTENVRTRLAGRYAEQALGWLRADLSAWTKVIAKGSPQACKGVAQTLRDWQRDPDLAGLRDKDAVDKLPEAERDACQKLWADVTTLLQRTKQSEFSRERADGAALAPGPDLLTPAAGATVENGSLGRDKAYVWEFTWNRIPGANQYHLYVRGAAARIPAIDLNTLSTSSYRFKATNGSYVPDANRRGWRWKVRARVNGVWTDWSEERRFDVAPLRK
ncbi:MAG TPA: protein kinase [Gemmataceae bacterium]|jgi:WD40 repeat protein/tRNA A-37 threonylcarbamoyl transferase component Bud32